MKICDGNIACSDIAYYFSEISSIYPITPSSPMASNIDSLSHNKLNMFGTPVKLIEMQSEAGAAGTFHGALISGSLASTFTASQGLLLMIPNMYKIAGEMLPGVVHVAARTIATNALSIFGDHSDIYSTRSTGFAILASSNVYDAQNLAAVAHLSAIKGSIPFLHFFDGFRTSHEIDKVKFMDMSRVLKLIDKKALREFRDRAMDTNKPNTRGTAENDDIYFQHAESRNINYINCVDYVVEYMDKLNEINDTNIKPFNYYGARDAKYVIVAMGSVCETIKEVVDYLNDNGEKVGVVEVHLYRPFSREYFLKSIPKTVKMIAVLDRTKEAGSTGEPLFLDVDNIIKSLGSDIKVVGGRYGLSSKNTTPSMIKAIYDNLESINHNFTIGIEDDVTNLSIPYDKEFNLPHKGQTSFLVYGYGSDGMVSACKDLMKITGDSTDAYVQGYFQYDSKKSGGVTLSHLRFSKTPIRSTYYVGKAKLLVCTQDAYLTKFRFINKIKKNGVFLLNSSKTDDEILSMISGIDKKYILDNNIKVYVTNAYKVAKKEGLGNKISAIMEALIFKFGHILDSDYAINKMKDNLDSRFKLKGNNIAEKNKKAVDNAINTTHLLKINENTDDYVEVNEISSSLFDIIDKREGDTLPVSAFLDRPDGTVEGGLSRLEKRDISEVVPKIISENCISCNLCSLVCPHAVIRPFLLDKEEVEKAPTSLNDNLLDSHLGDNLKFTIAVSYKDCTGCGLCANICPGKKGAKALEMVSKESIVNDITLKETEYLFNEVTEKDVMSVSTVKGSQFKRPRFEFSGACAGCGETPYLKLLTQLFGDRLVIANATGCSSIYGASSPSTPYSVPWANSLFEDNAEFGFGMKIADEVKKQQLKNIINENISKVDEEEKDIYLDYVNDINVDTAKALLSVIPHTKIKPLKSLKKYIMPISLWAVGGDGWAYDIGYNGIDHVLNSGENVNILVLDTEVYSNTGGQASKSSRVGAVAKFASSGKKTAKKDLLRIALTNPNVYVGAISLGANPAATVKVMLEAEKYNGPSIIVAYSPCIAWGILKGMSNSIDEEKKAMLSGYFPIFHYNPDTKEFKMDGKSDFNKYQEYLTGEDRYKSLKIINSDEADTLLKENEDNAKERNNYYESLTNKNKE